MNIDEVTKAQAKILMAGLFPGGHCLAKLKERMVKAGFPHDDPLFLLVCKSYDAERELHGMVCGLAATGNGSANPADEPSGEGVRFGGR